METDNIEESKTLLVKENEQSKGTASQVLYTASPEELNRGTPVTFELVFRICKVTIFHWSFGLVLIPIFKTFFGMELSRNSFLFVLCVIQVVLSATVPFLSWLTSEAQPKDKVIKNWSKHIVVITGGSSGLGLLLAQSLAIRKATVAILDIKKPDSTQVGLNYYECDVSNSRATIEALKEIKEDLGVPTILINNAGIHRSTILTTANVTDIEKTIKVNLLGPFVTTKTVLPWMLKENWGHIVNISSVLGLSPPSGFSSYCASKSGLNSLHDSLYQEITSVHQNANLKATLVFLGHLKTEMFKVDDVTYPWLFPKAEPLEVVRGIIHNLEYHMSGELFYPFYAHFAPLFRFCPLSLRTFVLNKIGANQSMISWQNNSEKDSPSKDSKSDQKPTIIFSGPEI